MVNFRTKRVYDDPSGLSSDDGFRIYVDRLWPRGESKAKFHYDIWDKGIAPSTQLREWFHEAPETRWDEFKRRYIAELDRNPETDSLLDTIKDKPTVTLLYSSKDESHNNAVVLAEFLYDKLK